MTTQKLTSNPITIVGMTFFISITAKFCPRQTRLPLPNPRCEASMTRNTSGLASNHLSGRKVSASSPNALGFRWRANCKHPTEVP